ncbi:hypothetical protein [Propionispora hippei]|uniref:Uncharacterized protein n=1 Tax=Propionispora hippei DSM 15287 TaxID=1123003 RepID=A0A1M6JCR7_9FIRM|nr:hypothetical protein [Propionispora hippei]SHJ44420.1 hypothetical protein SAMN02745170_02548 [Propionispora hippei DSM 15287]
MAMESNRKPQINRTSMRMRGSVFLCPAFLFFANPKGLFSLQNKLSIKQKYDMI